MQQLGFSNAPLEIPTVWLDLAEVSQALTGEPFQPGGPCEQSPRDQAP